jgi:AAA domain
MKTVDTSFMDEPAFGATGKTPPPGTKPDRFHFTPFREIQIGSSPPYTVARLIPRLGVVVIWGKPKCGKTFWTFDLEMHVALGWSYRDYRVE